MEDEPQLLLLLEKHLRRLGFDVDAHATGLAAVGALEKAEAPYDLAVADMGLPDVSGEALLKRIFALRPALPVVICSGSEFFIASLPQELQHRVRFLQKPFSPKELAQRIDEMIGR